MVRFGNPINKSVTNRPHNDCFIFKCFQVFGHFEILVLAQTVPLLFIRLNLLLERQNIFTHKMVFESFRLKVLQDLVTLLIFKNFVFFKLFFHSLMQVGHTKFWVISFDNYRGLFSTRKLIFRSYRLLSCFLYWWMQQFVSFCSCQKISNTLMIWSQRFVRYGRLCNCFEFMFVFCKCCLHPLDLLYMQLFD